MNHLKLTIEKEKQATQYNLRYIFKNNQLKLVIKRHQYETKNNWILFKKSFNKQLQELNQLIAEIITKFDKQKQLNFKT